MTLNIFDWLIVSAILAFIILIVVRAKRYTISVADFLAANRTAGRYLLAVAEGAASAGVIGFIGMWEMYYEAGFTPEWWIMMTIPGGMIITLTGYVIYRYRQTKALTLAQFFEIRYSKNFRVFAGALCFLSGILNFGIFPAIGARFFIYFAGFPEKLHIMGLVLPTFATVMAILLLLSLLFVWLGGQIAIITADFFGGLFANITYMAILVASVFLISWSQITASLSAAPVDHSLINPFQGGEIKNFNMWYFIIATVGTFYSFMSWQGTQAYNCSAKSPHEAKMARIVGVWRYHAQGLLLLIVPIIAYTVMHSVDFSPLAAAISHRLAAIPVESVRSQMTVPVVLSVFLPTCIKGCLFGIMVAGFIANHGTYMHSWGSIFIQDVILPLRKQSLTAGQHLIFLRLSVAGVTVFIFLFSLFYKPNEAVLMFFALTGSIFIGGSGAVLIGGLYWKRGTTAGAWSALAVGAAISIGAFILRELWPTIFGSDFPINSQWIYAITMISSTTVYVIVSLVQNRIFNLDKMLNRGIYAESELNESQSPNTNSGTLLKNVINKLGLSKEFTGGDKILFYATLFWSIGWFVVFIFGMAYNWLNPIPDNAWLKLWAAKVIIAFLLGAVCTVWISIGGIRDLRFMFHALGTASRDHKDDGTVADLYERKKNVQQEVQSEMLDK